MIARSWDGLTAAGEAEAYAEYVRRTGVKELLDTRGNRGVYLLRRREGDKTRFRVLSLWDSMEGIRRFAGDEPERARYYPEDERFLTALPPNVEHFEVVSAGGTRGAGAEARVLARELETLGRGETWHGPALAELLQGVSARAASTRPIASAHTIWELVLHVTAWTDVFRRRIEGEALEEPEAGDFPAPPQPTRRGWVQATQALFEGHRALAERVASLSDADLSRRIRGRDFDVRFQVRAAIRHVVYHSGQIGLLRKVSARRPRRMRRSKTGR
jgi:heme-degrading monooxygenase HmoA/uncharacterized damage-inducible protein DinB